MRVLKSSLELTDFQGLGGTRSKRAVEGVIGPAIASIHLKSLPCLGGVEMMQNFLAAARVFRLRRIVALRRRKSRIAPSDMQPHSNRN